MHLECILPGQKLRWERRGSSKSRRGIWNSILAKRGKINYQNKFREESLILGPRPLQCKSCIHHIGTRNALSKSTAMARGLGDKYTLVKITVYNATIKAKIIYLLLLQNGFSKRFGSDIESSEPKTKQKMAWFSSRGRLASKPTSLLKGQSPNLSALYNMWFTCQHGLLSYVYQRYFLTDDRSLQMQFRLRLPAH